MGKFVGHIRGALRGGEVTPGKYFYVVGGGGPSGRLLRCHPASDSWTLLAPTRKRRQHTAAGLLGRRIDAVGGRSRSEGELHDVKNYDSARDVRATGPKLSQAPGGFAVVSAHDALWVFGGEVIVSGRVTLASKQDSANGKPRNWCRGPDLPIPLRGVPVVAAGGFFHVLGGSEQAGAISNRGKVSRLLIPGSW